MVLVLSNHARAEDKAPSAEGAKCPVGEKQCVDTDGDAYCAKACPKLCHPPLIECFSSEGTPFCAKWQCPDVQAVSCAAGYTMCKGSVPFCLKNDKVAEHPDCTAVKKKH
jgi:hypothetical protein